MERKDFMLLIKASAAGDMKKLQAAIEAGADVNGTVDLGGSRKREKLDTLVPQLIYEFETPLHVALRNSASIDCVRLLISAGADVNAMSPRDGHPLCILVGKNNIECVKMLIEAGADVNIMNSLCAVVSHNNDDCVKMLIETGADVNKVNPGQGTPLCVAVERNNIDCVKLLIEAGADVNTYTSLSNAVSGNHIACAKVLIEAGADVNEVKPGHGTPLCIAILVSENLYDFNLRERCRSDPTRCRS